MRNSYNVAVILNVLIFLSARAATLNHENFTLNRNIKRDKLTNYLSTMLCSIDFKFANIYFELESKGTFLDGIFTESSRCVPLSMTVIGIEKSDEIIITSTGAHLIIIVLKGHELNQSLLHIRRKEIFNLFFLIFSESQISDGHENILQMLYWKHNVLNAVVVVQGSDHYGPSVITYNPFKNSSIRIPNNVYKRSEIFMEKNSNLFGNSMNIVMYKDTVTSLKRRMGTKSLNFNYDVFLPPLMTAALNATQILYTPFTKDFTIKDIQHADLTINGRNYVSDILQDVGIEETISFRRDDICVFVPYNRNRNMFENVSRIVKPIVWAMSIVVIVLTSICLYTISRFQRHETWNYVSLFDLFRYHMNQSLTHMPKRITTRLIIASWLMYCVIINSVWQGSLYTSLANKKESRISTIDQLLNTNQHTLLVSNIFYDYSKYFLNDSAIKNRFEVIDFRDYLSRVESNQIQYAYVARSRGAKYFENIQIVDGLPIYYTMDQCIVPFMTFYFVRRGCPLLDRINYLLRLTEESGLFNYWEDQLANAYKKLKHYERLLNHKTFNNLENFGFVFEMWGYGLVLSTAAFIIEYASKWFKLPSKYWM